MTTAPAAPADGDHAHDDHAHAFDGEPARALPADEPRTPGWVPLLGLSLFVLAGIVLLVMGDKPGEGAEKAASRPSPAQTAPPANAAPQVPTPSRDQPAAARAAPAGSAPSLPNLTPEQLRAIQKQIDEGRARQGAKPPSGDGHAH